MDLSDLWQQHKGFIITVAAALLLLLIGRTIIGGTYDWEAALVNRNSENGKLATIETVPPALLKKATGERKAMEDRANELAKRLTFKVGDEYKLDPNEKNPQGKYFELMDKKAQQLVIAPARLDISVPESLGLPETVPGDREEVARSLMALNVVNNVVEYAVAAHVKRIVKIKYESGASARLKRQGFLGELSVQFEIEGTGRALADFFEFLATGPERGEPFLQVAQGSELKADQTGDLIKATFQVQALTVDMERNVLAKS